jgi:hypothetical protein
MKTFKADSFTDAQMEFEAYCHPDLVLSVDQAKAVSKAMSSVASGAQTINQARVEAGLPPLLSQTVINHMTDPKQLIQRLVDELERRDWTFVDGIPEHYELERRDWTFVDGIPEHFECDSCDGGGPKQGNQPKHADYCSYVKALDEAKAYCKATHECDPLRAQVKKFEDFLVEHYGCPEAYGFEGPDTFPNCGTCLWCITNKRPKNSVG